MKPNFAGLVLAALVSLAASPAFAEVCDKIVGDGWNPAHGPVSIFNPIGFPWAIVVPVALLVWAFKSGSRRVAFGIAIAMGVLVVIGQLPVFDAEIVHNGMTMHQMGVAEGCLRPDGPADFILPAVMIAALIWIGMRHSRRESLQA